MFSSIARQKHFHTNLNNLRKAKRGFHACCINRNCLGFCMRSQCHRLTRADAVLTGRNTPIPRQVPWQYVSILCGPFLVWTHFCSGKTARTCQRWIFEWFLAFETQACWVGIFSPMLPSDAPLERGWRKPRRKGQKAPERHAGRRVCPCHPMVRLCKHIFIECVPCPYASSAYRVAPGQISVAPKAPARTRHIAPARRNHFPVCTAQEELGFSTKMFKKPSSCKLTYISCLSLRRNSFAHFN